jgi:hypothetical protein
MNSLDRNLESTASEPKRSVAADVESTDVKAEMSFSFNKTLVVLNLSNSVRIDTIFSLFFISLA